MSQRRFIEDMMAGFIEDLRSLKSRPTVHIKSMATEAVLGNLSDAMTSFKQEGAISEIEADELWTWFLNQLEREGLINRGKRPSSTGAEATVGVSLVESRSTDEISAAESELDPRQEELLRRLNRMVESMPQPGESTVLRRVIPLTQQVEVKDEEFVFVSLECWSHGFSLELATPFDHEAWAEDFLSRKDMTDLLDRFWAWEARDDVGGVYSGHTGGSSGHQNWMRSSVWFTPSLDETAGSITLEALTLDGSVALTATSVQIGHTDDRQSRPSDGERDR